MKKILRTNIEKISPPILLKALLTDLKICNKTYESAPCRAKNM